MMKAGFENRWSGVCLAEVVFLSVTTFLLLFASVAFAGTNRPERVIVLTDAAGLGDKGFNDVCWQGVLKAKNEFGLNARFVQSREQADYVPNLTMAAKNADIVVTLGFLYIEAVKEVAPKFPGTKFIHIEGDISAPNVESFDFKSEEGGYLAGIVGGLFTKARKIGVVTGMEIPPVKAYEDGFRAGIKEAEKERGAKIEVTVVSVGSFNDPVKAKSLAKGLIDRGADVLFRLAGNSGIGVMEAVKGTDGVYLMAEDLDQDGDLPGKILVSTLKKMDVAVFGAIESVMKGTFKGGHRVLGAADDAVDISEMKFSHDLFTPKDLERIQNARRLLKSGGLRVGDTGL